MGYKIALTGLVLFFACSYLYVTWKGRPAGEVCAIIAGLSLIAVPIGVIIGIWQ